MGEGRKVVKKPGAPPSGPWAARLPEEEAAGAAKLRLIAGVEVCAAGDGVWLRGPALDAGLARALRGLPGAERFRVDERGRLTRIGKRLPSGALPGGPWQPIAGWMTPRPQSASRPAAAGGFTRARLALIRSGAPAEAGALLLALADWSRWALAAPEIRLQPLRFAVSETDEVLVVGTPLPPLPGKRFVNHDGVLVPAGFTWDPPVDAAELRAIHGASIGDVLLLDGGDAHPLVEGSAFVRATRSAVRLSGREGRDGPA